LIQSIHWTDRGGLVHMGPSIPNTDNDLVNELYHVC
jgi:hypothetical protein